MSKEAPPSARTLLNKLVRSGTNIDTPKTKATPEELRKKQLFERAGTLIVNYGDSDKRGDPKRTDSLIYGLHKGAERLLLQMSEDADNPGGYALKVEALRGSNRTEAEEVIVSLSKEGVKWSGTEVTDDDIALVEGAVTLLESGGLTPPMDPWEKIRYKEESKLDSKRMFYQWEMEDRYRRDRDRY